MNDSATVTPDGLDGVVVLFSVNPWIKLEIQRSFFNDIHFVWCGTQFDPHARNESGAAIPPSSSPAKIFRRLSEDCTDTERHSDMIDRIKGKMLYRARIAFKNKQLSEDQWRDATFLIKNADHKQWRPLVYVIPTVLVRDRVKRVAASKRAGVPLEYQIADLKRHEFSTIDH